VQILEKTIGTNVNPDVKVQHKSMHVAISRKCEGWHTKRGQDVKNALKIDGDTHTDTLVDNVIVEANQLCIPKRLFVLINNNICLTKWQTNWSLIESTFKAFHVFEVMQYEVVVLGTFLRTSWISPRTTRLIRRQDKKEIVR
jgi:hypothetical protein